MSDLNIRNNLHVGIEFDAQGDNLVATVTPQTVGAAPTVHTHEIAQVDGLQTALNNKQDVGGNFDTRYLRIDSSQSLSGGSQTFGRNNLGLGSAAVLNVPSVGDAAAYEVVLGNDSRLSGSGGGGAVYTARGNVSGAVTVDLDGENDVIQSMTLTGNTTVTLSNFPSDYAVVTLMVSQDAVGSRTLTVSGSTTILNGGDGLVAPAANSRSIVTIVTWNGGSTLDVAIADPRPPSYDSIDINPQGDGAVYKTFAYPTTLNVSGGGITKRGTGTVVFAKSTGGAFSTVSGASEPFAAGDVLRITTSGFSDWLTLSIPRVA